jgi:DnaK suppressor protein
MAINASGLTDAQIKELKKALEDKLAGTSHEIRELEATLTEKDSEDKGSPDEVDRSSFEEEMQRTQLVMDQKKMLQFEVMEAIKRTQDGSYGVCEETEEPIGYKRLRAQPWTRLSLDAQQELENRRKSRSGGSGHVSSYGSSSGDSDGASDE